MWRSWNDDSSDLRNNDFSIFDNPESFQEETDFNDTEIALEDLTESRMEDIF